MTQLQRTKRSIITSIDDVSVSEIIRHNTIISLHDAGRQLGLLTDSPVTTLTGRQTAELSLSSLDCFLHQLGTVSHMVINTHRTTHDACVRRHLPHVPLSIYIVRAFTVVVGYVITRSFHFTNVTVKRFIKSTLSIFTLHINQTLQ